MDSLYFFKKSIYTIQQSSTLKLTQELRKKEVCEMKKIKDLETKQIQETRKNAEKISKKIVELGNEIAKLNYDYNNLKNKETKKAKNILDKIEKKRSKINELEKKLAELRKLEYILNSFRENGAAERHASLISRLVARIISLSEAQNKIEEQRKTPTKIIREFVTLHPTGFTESEKEELGKLGNKIWISPDGKYSVELVPSPTYSISVDDLVKLIGIQKAIGFMKVDCKMVSDAADAGLLTKPDPADRRKEIVLDKDDIERIRQRHDFRAERVIARMTDNKTGKFIIAVLDKELYKKDVASLETLRGLDKSIITALKENNIETVGDLRNIDLLGLTRLRGIGEKRAIQIWRAIYKTK